MNCSLIVSQARKIHQSMGHMYLQRHRWCSLAAESRYVPRLHAHCRTRAIAAQCL